jgi:hypothetical protein
VLIWLQIYEKGLGFPNLSRILFIYKYETFLININYSE